MGQVFCADGLRRLTEIGRIGILAVASSFVCAQANAAYEASFDTIAMGTLVSARVWDGSEESAGKLVDEIEKSVGEYEEMFTVRGEGPMARVNQYSGAWVDVGCEAASVVRLALDIAKESDSSFEPTIGPLVNAWKIGFGGKSEPEKKTLDRARALVDYTKVEVREENGKCSIRIGRDQSIDLGAIAKGAIATGIIEKMRRLGADRAVIDLGGNVAVLGNSPAGRPWRVGIQKPGSERGTVYAAVDAASGESVITSGSYERNFEKNGRRYGHILSARTGRPVEVDIGSVTVIDRDGAKADGWCTALYAMGSEKALNFLRKRTDICAIIVDNDLKTVWISPSIAKRFMLIDESMQVKLIGQQTL